MDFLDEVVIKVRSGDGGNGCISFRREKYVPRGGPNGGDGGKGGNIILKAKVGIYSLIDFAFKRTFQAKRGAHGRGKNCTGKDGKDLVINVPVGTLIKDEETGKIIADLTEDGQQTVIVRGGKGGRGNQHFATPHNRAPRVAEPGELGCERKIRLILKSIADIGLVGFPNAGKSTLLSRISKARPKIAPYPFTTMYPNLGVIFFDEYDFSLTMADIPGLIKDAHKGKGLGHRFLRHIERTKLLLYVMDITFDSQHGVMEDFEIIQNEISEYDGSLLDKPCIVAINKMDIYDPSLHRSVEEIQRFLRNRGILSFPISAKTGEGLDNLKEGIYRIWNPQKRPSTIGQSI